MNVLAGCDYMNIGVLSLKFHVDCIHIITMFLLVYLRWIREMIDMDNLST